LNSARGVAHNGSMENETYEGELDQADFEHELEDAEEGVITYSDGSIDLAHLTRGANWYA
jgi:hypothetical protein